VAAYLLVLEKVDGHWLICRGARSNGVAPAQTPQPKDEN
jgi:hypothetical protein